MSGVVWTVDDAQVRESGGVRSTRAASSLSSRVYASHAWLLRLGLTNGNQPPMTPGDHLQPHTTFDLALVKEFGERFSVNLQAINVANRRVLLDNRFTFVARILSNRAKFSCNCGIAFAIDSRPLCGFLGIASLPSPEGRVAQTKRSMAHPGNSGKRANCQSASLFFELFTEI